MRFFLAFFLAFTSACGTNIWSGAVAHDSDSILLEDARIQMDNEDYAGALTTLGKVKGDSNELRLLRSSAGLGVSGLSLWSILLEIVDSDKYKSQSGGSSGVDKFFDLISSSVLGEGTVRSERILALTTSISDLLSAPDQESPRPKTLACLFAGMMALPLVADATTAIQATTVSLNELAATVDVNNQNATCPDTSNLDTNLGIITQTQSQFSLVLQATADCKLLSTSDSGADLNAIEAKLQKFSSVADRGCSPSPACGSSQACKALGLSCVYDLLASSSASSVAGDSAVSSCELVQNCLTPGSCF